MDNPPTIAMWLMAPRLAVVVLKGIWDFAMIPIEWIIGISIMRGIMDSVRESSKGKDK